MPYEEKDLEDKLVLKRYDKKRQSIYCVPKELKVNRTYPDGDEKGKLWPYAGAVPGRKHYPEDKSIPLEIYCGRKQKTEPTGALVRVVWQEIVHTPGRTSTTPEYIITEVKK